MILLMYYYQRLEPMLIHSELELEPELDLVGEPMVGNSHWEGSWGVLDQ